MESPWETGAGRLAGGSRVPVSPGPPPLPRGLMLLLFRLPKPLFRSWLARLFAGRLLLLTHKGRRTGLRHQTVLEVLRYDPKDDVYYVASAWGERTDWFQNLLKTPRVTIQVGRKRVTALAAPLSPARGREEVMGYIREHPILARLLPRLAGYNINGSLADYDALARAISVVALEPEG